MLWKQVHPVCEHTTVTVPSCLVPDSFIFACQVRDNLRSKSPDDVPIPHNEVENSCRTSYGYSTDAGAVHSLSTLALLLTLALQTLITLTAL